MRLSNERYEQIKEIVVDMYERLEINCVPISGFEIATKMGIIVIPYSARNLNLQILMMKESEDGFFVEKMDGTKYIFYNDKKDYGRINNTMLHEIGHCLLEHSQESEIAEAEVKFFAKYALVPPVLIDKLGIKDPFDIVKTFDVSFEAACNAIEYYHRWKEHSFENLPYDRRILKLFKKGLEAMPIDTAIQ